MSSLIKNLLIALAIAVVIWLGYMFFVKDDSGSGSTTVVRNETGAAQEAEGFKARLQQLNAISFESTVFSDPRFNSLVDFRQELRPEPVGRANPFAPVR